MNIELASLEHGSVIYISALVVLVIATDYVWRWPQKWHPLTVVHILASKISHKVKPTPEAPVQQHWISGTLAFVVLFSPFIFLLYLLQAFAAYRIFFDFFLLLSAFSFSNQRHAYKRIVYALSTGKKNLAREWSKLLVKRDTQNLTDIGVAKAAMEGFSLRYTYQCITVLCVFTVGGALSALVYRMALECKWAWKQPSAKSDEFVAPITLFCKVCQCLPVALTFLMIFCLVWPRNTTQQKRESVSVGTARYSGQCFSAFILHTFAKRLGFTMAGPLQYGGEKQRFVRLGAPLQVRFSDMHAMSTTLHLLTLIILLGACAALALSLTLFA